MSTDDIIWAQAAKCVYMKVLTEDIMGAQVVECVCVCMKVQVY